jgi:hypothetical protein
MCLDAAALKRPIRGGCDDVPRGRSHRFSSFSAATATSTERVRQYIDWHDSPLSC